MAGKARNQANEAIRETDSLPSDRGNLFKRCIIVQW